MPDNEVGAARAANQQGNAAGKRDAARPRDADERTKAEG